MFGIKDQAFVEYMKDPARFADLVNGTLFGGRQIINSKFLINLQRKNRLFLKSPQHNHTKEKASHQNTPNKESFFLDFTERERDCIMLHDKPGQRCLIGCEGQTEADYNMSVRNFSYDGIEYMEQINTGKYQTNDAQGHVRPLIPIFNVVLYFGSSRWKTKQRLQDLMNIPDNMEDFIDLLPDYRIYVADVYEQNPELFHTEWKDIFLIMKHSRKKKELKKYVENHMDEVRKLSVDTRLFLAALLDQYKILDNGKMEVIDMCEAWDGAMMMYRDEGVRDGIKIGRKQGFQYGRKNSKLQIAKNMYLRGYSPEDAAAVLDETTETVQKWFQKWNRI